MLVWPIAWCMVATGLSSATATEKSDEEFNALAAVVLDYELKSTMGDVEVKAGDGFKTHPQHPPPCPFQEVKCSIVGHVTEVHFHKSHLVRSSPSFPTPAWCGPRGRVSSHVPVHELEPLCYTLAR